MAVVLTDEFKNAINNAIADKAPILFAAVDDIGQPALSFRGSAQVFSYNEVGLWVRNTDGGFINSVAGNPRVAFMYRNAESRLAFQGHGEARKVDDEATVRKIYDMAPEVERNADPERKGTAVLVEIVRIIQRGAVVMER